MVMAIEDDGVAGIQLSEHIMTNNSSIRDTSMWLFLPRCYGVHVDAIHSSGIQYSRNGWVAREVGAKEHIALHQQQAGRQATAKRTHCIWSHLGEPKHSPDRERQRFEGELAEV
ncbi:uncharacterized protein LOC111266867 isoform X1 [Varroa jacobsoni]|uniref:uncharacterized protein LOC111266867 isoform X1 n=1 Tax=Varroa jacobsoni TaxID=62625 RepID=UPI000BF969CC|nr:uncharacterized protein LOC111266867 isoform X1 [Varroa jacobsoni]